MSIAAAPLTAPQGARGSFLEYLIGVAGNGKQLAELLGVQQSQVTRWKQGDQQPSTDSARGLTDFAYVVTRAGLTMHERVVPVWLDSPNQFLQGATPRECITLGRIAEVVSALEAEDEGAYA